MKLYKNDRYGIVIKSTKFEDDHVIFDVDMTSSFFDVTSKFL